MEVDNNRPSFFKIVFAGHSNDRLRIPSKFLKHISNELSNRATLKVHSGCSWNAKVSETSSSGIFIEDGWHQFLKDNSLGNNEFLLFTYEGNMCFNVQIFEVNGCERLNLPLIGAHQLSASTSMKRPPGRPRKHSPSTEHLKEDLARNLKTAESFKSKFPHFSCPVRRNTMYVTKSFSKEHLCPKRSKYVLRNLEGKSWVVNVNSGRQGHYFCGGWSRFMDDNNLERNDICIFELVDRLEMRVHIIRKGPGN